jgi:C-terminal processing protease CtpA/Prc
MVGLWRGIVQTDRHLVLLPQCCVRRYRTSSGVRNAMVRHFVQARAVRICLALILCAIAIPTPLRAHAAASETGVATLTGELDPAPWTHDLLSDSTYIMLADLTAFVQRDNDRKLDLQSEIVAPIIDIDLDQPQFSLALPISPQGQLNDLDNDPNASGGVQIFSVEVVDPFNASPFVGPDEFSGWSRGLSSMIVRNSTGEITGGQIAVWAPDDQQSISSGFGDDGLLFTDDDPVQSLEAGWTVLDLNASPFGFTRNAKTDIVITAGDLGFYDYGSEGMTEAFEHLLSDLELRYPYTVEKRIDWASLRRTYIPKIQQAEADNDQDAYQAALFDFSLEFHDGHVGTSPPDSLGKNEYSGFIGMQFAQTIDQGLVVRRVFDGSEAADAGILAGAQIVSWDGMSPHDALLAEPMLSSESTAYARLLDHVSTLAYGLAGSSIDLTYRNPDEDPVSINLPFDVVSSYSEQIQIYRSEVGSVPGQLPVTSQLLDSGVGYIRVSTFNDDPVLMTTSWNAALTDLLDFNPSGLIVDVRSNPGGSGTVAQQFAGSFYERSFTLGDNELRDADGAVSSFPITVDPGAVQWNGTPVAILIDQHCASACEIFSAAMAHDEQHMIVGYTPTAGILAAIGAWNLPGDVYFQASIIGVLRDGKPMLEGVGQPPTVLVPMTAANLLNPDDTILTIAVGEILQSYGGTAP